MASRGMSAVPYVALWRKEFGPGGPGGLPPRPGFPPMGPGMRPLPPGGGPPFQANGLPPRPPSEPGIRKSPSMRSLNSQYSSHDLHGGPAPPLPPFASPYGNPMIRNHSQPNLHAPQARPMLPSASSRAQSMIDPESIEAPSPPGSPVPEMPRHTGPVTQSVTAQMKCKVFLQQQHAQWKSLGSAKLKLYREDPTNVKQLVVEADDKKKSILISTIVLPDGVERVGKTGVAIELGNNGQRMGIVYMLQCRNETSAGGLFDSLVSGSDRGKKL
ncbi:hypothetical protein NMY22_g5133 [Coprinellus aureogranulatus]|nr:hypothetical protein NMY22_g5133 [Coprinellus aureogranulatus]